jgi:hypothetical protein
MDYPNDIVRTVKEHWVAVTPGYDCSCGHTHHGRELYRNGRMENLAPQYGFCDNDACPCTTLRRQIA